MFQTMEACTNFIFSLKASRFKGEPLEAAKKLLAYFGNPQNTVSYIHFAGSNGKGSTLNATREILMTHGLTVGAFISPHLERPNERITINKEQITDADFLQFMNAIDEAVQETLGGQYPSFFEVMTVLAFLYFAQSKPDVVLLETGIGGRIDTTNVIVPKVSVITTISLEHTDLLGDTLAKVASEKAGIIKANVPVVVGVKQQEALQVIQDTAHQLAAPHYHLGNELQIQYGEGEFSYKGCGRAFTEIELAMQGTHQMDNASLAISAALLFDPAISEATIRQALKQASWAGRFERVRLNVVLDGAHNLEGTEALLETLKRVEPNKNYTFLYAVMNDKDHQQSIDALSEVASRIVFTELSMPRAAKAQQLLMESTHNNAQVVIDWQSWLLKAIHQLEKDELLIVTGSLYFIAEAKRLLEVAK